MAIHITNKGEDMKITPTNSKAIPVKAKHLWITRIVVTMMMEGIDEYLMSTKQCSRQECSHPQAIIRPIGHDGSVPV